MAILSDLTLNWSTTPVTLIGDEIWQARGGAVFVTTTSNPAEGDGLSLIDNKAVRFSAGSVVRYRKENGQDDPKIIRERV